GLDEPFDCRPDARRVSDAILARSAELNCRLPSRVNIAFGGCSSCRAHARINDAGFESRVVDGQAGYRLWAGGSLGTMPALALEVVGFLPRAEVVAAAEALVDVFVTLGDIAHPKRGRMKFAVERVGADGFRAAFDASFARGRARCEPAPPPVETLGAADFSEALAIVPPGGWAEGARPQRTPGRAMVTVNVPLGDLTSDEMRLLSSLAPTGDGQLHLTRNQNAMFRDVCVADIPGLRLALASHGLSTEGADAAGDVRACTGSAVCALGITAAPAAGARLIGHSALARNSGLRVHVSGCPNSCAQHQAAAIGLSGATVRINGEIRLGYHVWLGGDLEAGRLGVLAGRVADDSVEEAVGAIVGCWEATRAVGESLPSTVARIGADAFCRHLEAVASGFQTGAGEAEPPEVSRALPIGGALTGGVR
ncbi:MAG TPA: nitrite/sulfite reductase, partial [Acidimicrobiales bacterium]